MEVNDILNSTDFNLTDFQDLNVTEGVIVSEVKEFQPGDAAWTLVATAMVWLMVPGVGFLYCGMSRSKSALTLLTLCIWSTAVVSVQWFLIGYSLSFSSFGNVFIGNVEKAFFWGVAEKPSEANPRIPEILFCMYQGMFACITPALVIGSTAERGRFLSTIVFIFFWTTLVYDPICYWVWGPHGWFFTMGGLDFAGGLPVHLASGVSAAVYAWLLKGRDEAMKDAKPHNIVQVVLGTSLIWFGYFGFNGASALGANARAALVVCNTNLSACIAGIVWTLLDYARDRKFSALSFCFGAISGLVTVTPASGFIIPASSAAFGVIGAIGCRYAVHLKNMIHVDDALDVLAVHGVGGAIGTVLCGFFAQQGPTSLDGLSTIDGGMLDGPEKWMQVVVQLAGCGATTVWSLFVTFLILFVMNKTPGLKLRVSERVGKAGIDSAQMGETAYDYSPVPHRKSVGPLSLEVPQGHGHQYGRRKSSVAVALHHIKRFTINED